MRNHILFKALALLLCALSLFGMVAAAAGVIVLAEGNLYNKTVDQMLTDCIRSDGTAYASFLAQEYTSEYLGGVPAQLVNAQFSHANWFYRSYDQAHYGYAILDAQGQEVYGYNVELKSTSDPIFRESFPVAGNYMHLVSLESQENIQDTLRQNREDIYNAEPTLTLYDNAIPPQGTVVNYAVFTDEAGELILDAYNNGNSTVVTTYSQDGSDTLFHDGSQVGLLLFDQTRHLAFHSFFSIREDFPDRAVKEVSFQADNGLSLRLRAAEGNVGTLYLDDSGYIRFLSTQAAVSQEPPEETIPEETAAETTAPTVPETVPPTVPETQPQETWEEEEVWEEEYWEEENWEESSASAVPEEEWTETVPPTVPETTAATLPPETTVPPAEETLPPATEPEMINGKLLAEYQLNTITYWDSSTGENMQATFIYLPMPELTVELYLEADALRYAPLYDILRVIRPYRNYLLPAAAGFALLFVLLGIYLILAAGRSPKQEGIRAGGLNRLPLDLYFVIDTGLISGLIAGSVAAANQLLKTDFLLFCGLTAGAIFLACLVFVGFCFAWAAQWKTGGSFVWKNSFCARFLGWLVLAAIALEKFLSGKLLPVLWRILKKAAGVALKVWNWLIRKLKAGLGTLFQGLHRFLKLLPLAWQWFLGGAFLICFALIANTLDGFFLVVGILLCAALVAYTAYSFAILADSTRRMSKGDLETKVADKNLLGCFKDSAADLNALADVAVVAAQKQLKSERMKTELITNVSHDIKTPLTSIINYVDLLQKPHTEQEQAQYLEVLDRQSQRLKKLIDDLMDMSKANTGNMAVEITQLDAVESVNQALGEFADKLEKAQLTPVFRHSVVTAPILADGKLVWRVMSNLLGNAVKYAMPGTRLYIDLVVLEGKVVLSLKNISREELNIDADELMERFVRGDDARNTEGSGLGLNIAKSLMELQKGQLQLLVDGDLFKVTLSFPGA